MASSDLKDDFGGWLDAEINQLDEIIKTYHEEDWERPLAHFEQRRFALSLARCEFWEVISR